MLAVAACDSGETSRPSEGSAATSTVQCVDVQTLAEAGAVTVVTQSDGSTIELLEATSGDFTAGNFAVFLSKYAGPVEQFAAKLYWIPLHSEAPRTESLQLTVEYLDDTAVSPTILELGGDGNWSRTNDGSYFWPSRVPLPHLGRWRITAEATGLREGCFELVER